MKTKLTEELIKELGENLAEGLPLRTTCDLLGITTMSISNWMKKGEEDYEADVDTLFASLFYTIKKSRAQYEKTAMRVIQKGDNGWQGSAWWLERTRPEYMPKQSIEAGSDGKVTVVLGGKVKSVTKNDDNQ